MSPDFFIAGAARSGTTALFQYLSRHPNVFMPRIKEPQYFCSDLNTVGAVRSFVDYSALFAGVPPGSLTGEASCWYLYSKIAMRRMMAHNPYAKVVIVLRHPAEAAHSLHAAAWGHGHENIEDFETAWHAQPDRLAGRRMPEHWPDAATLQYGAIYRYADQIKRVLAAIPPKQLRIEIHEEFFANPAKHYGELLDFLGLERQPCHDFPVVNASVRPRSNALDRMLRKPPGAFRLAYAPLRTLLHAAGVHPGRALWRLNAAPQPKPELRPAFRVELQQYFADDMAKLERLLTRSLDVWRSG